MAVTQMYDAKVGSPTTVITGNLTAGTTTIPVQDIAALTAAPGLATLLDGQGNQEVISYTGITGNDLTGVVRGFEGDAQSWPTGTFISRRLTAYDVNTANANIESLDGDVTTLETNKVETTAFNDHSTRHETGGTDEISLAGLLGEPAELMTHKADIASQTELGHVSVDGITIFVDENGKLSTLDGNIYYFEGNENTTLTGGWVEGASQSTGNQSKQADHLYLESSSSSIALRTYVTDTLVDLSDINVLKIDWENIGASNVNNYSAFVVSTSKSADQAMYDARILAQNLFSRKIDELDVSMLTGSYYVRVHARDGGSSVNIPSIVKCFKIWGED